MNKILIVEDNKAFRDTLTDLFGMWRPELNVLHASNGAEGVAVAVEKHPDLILVDGNMPIMDGVSAAQTLRKDPETKDIPLIGMTAQHDRSTISQGLTTFCNSMLPKPFNMTDLIKTMKGLKLC